MMMMISTSMMLRKRTLNGTSSLVDIGVTHKRHTATLIGVRILKQRSGKHYDAADRTL